MVFSKKAFASLKLNEIYPAPSTGEYEWIELYNDEDQIIDISQYQLLDLAGNKIKISTQSALPLDFVLATSSSVLNNTGDTISLKNNLGEIIEIATYSANFDPTKTYVKCPDGIGSWFVLNTLTKKNSNETACQILTPTPIQPTPTDIQTPNLGVSTSPTPTKTQIPTISPIPQSYDNIYISEVMVNPPSGEKEWLEIYNNNDFPVSLNNWYIDDLENAGSSPKMFFLEIDAKGFGVTEFTSSIFNNGGDSVRLLDFNKNLKNDFEYGKSEQRKTFGRTSFDSDDFCLQEASKNSDNNPCINPTPMITSIIASTCTGQACLSPTIKIVTTKISTPNDVSIHRSVNYPIGIAQGNLNKNNILGITDKTIINSSSNKSLIDLLCFLSFFYSLLAIVSILIKNKVLNKYALAS